MSSIERAEGTGAVTRKVWACEDCGWEWPLATEPPDEAECDNCGGPLEKVDAVFVAVIDTIEAVRAEGSHD